MQRPIGIIFILSVFLGQHLDATGKTPASPIFYRTKNSDEWVNRTFHIQKIYSRVLVVNASGQSPKTISLSALNLNSRESNQVGPTRRYKVYAIFKTLQAAADAARGGDLIAVMPGTYAGF